MGATSALVSKKDKIWFDLGKVFFEEKVVRKLKRCCKLPDRALLEDAIIVALQDESFNISSTPTEDRTTARDTASWMITHPDWRFITEADDTFDAVYLAEDELDAAEYRSEFEEDAQPIYMKSGSIEG